VASHYDTLADALVAGGIFYGLPGENVETALRAVVASMPLPEDFDREMLLNMFLSREHLGSTVVGDGIAIPHPRYPVVIGVPGPQATLCHLEHAIDFGAGDGRPVETLFVLVSPTARWHSRLLTQVARALANGHFRDLITRKAPADVIVEAARTFQIAAVGADASDDAADAIAG
jgi:PTS system nitrogen regulatory IIA component